jgi:hypothetical protein
MRFHTQIFIPFILLSALTYSQQNKSDSVQEIYSYESMLKLQTKFDEFDVYRELNYLRMDLPANTDTNTIWMWTKLSITNTGVTGFYAGETPLSMIEPLHQQYIENSKLNPVRYVLGMAQTAAVGYLAYQHIKKYGFFK